MGSECSPKAFLVAWAQIVSLLRIGFIRHDMKIERKEEIQARCTDIGWNPDGTGVSGSMVLAILVALAQR